MINEQQLIGLIQKPKSTEEKIKLAKKLYQELQEIASIKDGINWYQGKILYFFNEFELYDYLHGKALSKKAFYSEIDIPYSTVQFKSELYEFYIIKHKFSFKELQNANTKKLHRALKYVKTKPRTFIKKVIDLAEREKQSLSDFLINVGMKENYCLHQHKIEGKVVRCEDCGKVINGNGK